MSTIVDQYGSRISSTTLYRTPSQNPRANRPVAKPRAKTYEAVTAWQRREMVDVSRVIASGVPTIDGAITIAGEFAVGDSWHVKSRSSNKAWGKKRDTWINQFYYRDCNTRGEMYDFRTTLKGLIRSLKVEADYGVVFDSETGKFQIIKFDRIGTGYSISGRGVVSVGSGLAQCKEVGNLPQNTWTGSMGSYLIDDSRSLFDGQRIIDGVIVDQNLTPMGYRILGFDADGKETYADIPRAQLHFNFSGRRWLDQIRGIPELAESIMANMTLDDYDYLITMGMKLSAALSVTRESSDGNPARSNRVNYDEDVTDPDGTTRTRKVAVEEIFPGIVELAASNKESLKTLDYNRPSTNEQDQIRRIETAILHKLWPRSLIYPDEFARAGGRATTIQANTIVTYDQCCVERTARWIIDRATEWGMRNGMIPKNNSLYDPYEYVFTVPGKFTVDEGNDAKMRLAALGRCTISRGIICAADGYLAEEIEEEREAEVGRTLAAAVRLSQQFPDWEPKEIVLMLDTYDSNVSFSAQATPPETPDAAIPKEAKP